MFKKLFLVFLISFSLLLPFSADSANVFAPPIPARIGGSVTVDGTPLTQATDDGYTFTVTKQDGTAYVDLNGVPAQDLDGLNTSDWYLIDIPMYDAADQTGGANPGETAVIHVFKDGSELTVTSPANGEFAVSDSGTNTQIDLEVMAVAIDNSIFFGTFDYSISGTQPASCTGTDTVIIGSDFDQLNGACDYLYIPSTVTNATYSFSDCGGDYVTRTVTISGDTIHLEETGECSGVAVPCWTTDYLVTFDSDYNGGVISGDQYDGHPSVCQGTITGDFFKSNPTSSASRFQWWRWRVTYRNYSLRVP